MIFKEPIHIIGSQGFIGKAFEKYSSSTDLKLWSHDSKDYLNYFDLNIKKSWYELLNTKPKIVIILSWPGLPNYNNKEHLIINVPKIIKLVELLVDNGVSKIIFAGTCYEYGLANGELKESLITNPINNYAIAKDVLRRYISTYLSEKNINWGWLRIFYPYGPNQNENSLIPSLMKSIKDKKDFFNISSGRQIRDYVSVHDVAKHFMVLATHPKTNGIYNSGSGKPVSIYELVQKIILDNSSDLKIRRSYYKDRSDEPMAFWANIERITELIETHPYKNII